MNGSPSLSMKYSSLSKHEKSSSSPPTPVRIRKQMEDSAANELHDRDGGLGKKKLKRNYGMKPISNLSSKSSIFKDNKDDSTKTKKRKTNVFVNKSYKQPSSESSDEDLNLIDVKNLNYQNKLHGENFDEIDKILQSDKKSTLLHDSTTFASKLLGNDGNILSNFAKNNSDRINEVKKNYQHYNFPPPIKSRKLLKSRTLKYLDLIPSIIKGKIASKYYNLAYQQQKTSSNSKMSKDEHWQISWNKYVGGYYGLERQHFINLVILSKWRNLINSKESSNPTLRYWTTNDFSAYVLANEIIIRLVMEDMHCSQSKAEDIINKTTEYGTIVMDSIPLEHDLGSGELFAEDSKKVLKGLNTAEASANDIDPEKKDILSTILSSDSE